MVWLGRQRAALELYAGSEQGGGRWDSSLLALGIIVALQTRASWQLPTFVVKADLLQGYDLAWKEAVLLHSKWAGVGGSFWLCLDASFSHDRLRVRLGPLLGRALLLLQAGIGQGGRRAVHLFNALTRGLTDAVCNSCIGVAIGANPLMIQAFCGPPRSRQTLCQNPSPNLQVVASMITSCSQAVTEQDFRAVVPQVASLTEALLAIDAASEFSLGLVQFVDDIFVLQSTCWGLRRACQALTEFSRCWRHKFAGGSKSASFMAVGAAVPAPSSLAPVGDETPRHSETLSILGMLVDADLAFTPLLEQVSAKLLSETVSLATTLRDLAIGIPHQLAQWDLRVAARGLSGCEAPRQRCLRLGHSGR